MGLNLIDCESPLATGFLLSEKVAQGRLMIGLGSNAKKF